MPITTSLFAASLLDASLERLAGLPRVPPTPRVINHRDCHIVNGIPAPRLPRAEAQGSHQADDRQVVVAAITMDDSLTDLDPSCILIEEIFHVYHSLQTCGHSTLAEDEREDVVIVTNRGKPEAAIEGLKGEEDLEDYLLERSPKFRAMIRRARRGKSVSLAQVRKLLRSGTRRN